MEMVYSKELGLTTLPPSQQASKNMFTMSDTLAANHRLKGRGKTTLFFEVSERSIRYLTEGLGHKNLVAVQEGCRHLDDEPRWLIALISDTGMRLAEAAGLLSGLIWAFAD